MAHESDRNRGRQLARQRTSQPKPPARSTPDARDLPDQPGSGRLKSAAADKQPLWRRIPHAVTGWEEDRVRQQQAHCGHGPCERSLPDMEHIRPVCYGRRRHKPDTADARKLRKLVAAQQLHRFPRLSFVLRSGSPGLLTGTSPIRPFDPGAPTADGDLFVANVHALAAVTDVRTKKSASDQHHQHP